MFEENAATFENREHELLSKVMRDLRSDAILSKALFAYPILCLLPAFLPTLWQTGIGVLSHIIFVACGAFLGLHFSLSAKSKLRELMQGPPVLKIIDLKKWRTRVKLTFRYAERFRLTLFWAITAPVVLAVAGTALWNVDIAQNLKNKLISALVLLAIIFVRFTAGCVTKAFWLRETFHRRTQASLQVLLK